MNAFKLRIASPNGDIYSGDAQRIILRGAEGDLAVMAGHAPLTTPVRAGTCRITTADGETKELPLQSGLLLVDRSGTTLLTGGVMA